MRVPRGSTLASVYESLNKTQRKRLDSVEKARMSEPEAIRAVYHRTYESVRKAVNAGVPVRILADRLNVSAARVYQMRDQADAYAEEKKNLQSELDDN